MNLNRIDRFDILELIPQRAPFVMITELMNVREQSATSSFRILENNIFVKDGQFQESGLIENIAQTAAAMSGYKAKISGKAAEIGFLGSVKNLRIYYLPAVDTNLTTEVRLENQVLNVNLLKGLIRQEDKLVAECEMKIFLID